MSRTADRAMRLAHTLALVLVVVASATGCDSLDGRSRNKKGNRYFRETKFIDAAAEYEKALKTVDDPIIHYNLGLAYSKVFKPGLEKPVRLGVKGTFACDTIPKVEYAPAQVCVKEDDRRFDDCDEKNVCASSYECKKVDLCVMKNEGLAEAAATHFLSWLSANPDDEDTRKLMTQVWIDPGTGVKANGGDQAIYEAFKPGTGPNLVTSVIGVDSNAFQAIQSGQDPAATDFSIGRGGLF